MWPFSSQQIPSKKYPSVEIADVVAIWGENSGWEFVDPVLEVDCVLHGTDVFAEAIVHKMLQVRKWIVDLREKIDAAVCEHAGRAGLSVEGHEMQSMDVSALASGDKVDVCYVAPEWAGYAVNVVIEGGRIVQIYGGD